MKKILPLIIVTASVLLVLPLAANEQFNQGMQHGNANKGQGADAIKGFKPAEVIPGYTTSPAESGYYGGVTSSGVDMTSPGSAALSSSETGKAITESILNTPADNKPSMDAPFISAGTDMQDKAETVIDPSFDSCQEQSVTFTEISTHQCNRTPAAELSCTRTASIKENASTTQEKRIHTQTSTLINQKLTRVWDGTFTIPETGKLLRIDVVTSTIPIPYTEECRRDGPACNNAVNESFTLMGVGLPVTVTTWPNYKQNCSGSNNSNNCQTYLNDGVASVNGGIDQSLDVTAGQRFLLTKTSGTTTYKILPFDVTITLTYSVKVQTANPEVVWAEFCPFDKNEEVLQESICTQEGGVRNVTINGKQYAVHSDCWQYKDIYVSQQADNGTCSDYMNNAACTVNRTVCLESLAGICLSEIATFSCENKISGNGMMCGGEFFCTDGSCAQGVTGTSNMFGQAVSALAAVASAGEDVAELNGDNVWAFTGEGKSCKKSAAGFNNCCKDSGWGQDIGLSSCSSDEKALGEAKERKLTVYVGEYCSTKALGVCLEKKRGYCQFDSMLARIVQEQGRRGQLGVGFGSGKSPDCRGITVDELQSLDFGVMNFSDFYSDLDAGSAIPEDQALLQKAQDIIAEKMKENAP